MVTAGMSAMAGSLLYSTWFLTGTGRVSYSSDILLWICIPLQRHNYENSKQIFPEKELHGLSPNFHIRVSVSDLFIPRIGLPFLLQENMWTDSGHI